MSSKSFGKGLLTETSGGNSSNEFRGCRHRGFRGFKPLNAEVERIHACVCYIANYAAQGFFAGL